MVPRKYVDITFPTGRPHTGTYPTLEETMAEGVEVTPFEWDGDSLQGQIDRYQELLNLLEDTIERAYQHVSKVLRPDSPGVSVENTNEYTTVHTTALAERNGHLDTLTWRLQNIVDRLDV